MSSGLGAGSSSVKTKPLSRCAGYFAAMVITLFFLPSTVCQGVSVRQRRLHSQKENQGGEKDPGAPVPTALIFRGEPPGKGVTGVYSWLTSDTGRDVHEARPYV